MKNLQVFIALPLVLLMFNACKKDKYTDTVTVRMQDAPASYDSVNVEILEVTMHSDAQGWVTVPTNAGIYNLLDLQNGIDTLLAIIPQFPAGHTSQMRLLLGDENYVVSGGTVTPLALSSQDEVGLKLNLNYNFDPNQDYEILIDFDAAQSIVVEGNGTLRLKPVLKTVHIHPI